MYPVEWGGSGLLAGGTDLSGNVDIGDLATQGAEYWLECHGRCGAGNRRHHLE